MSNTLKKDIIGTGAVVIVGAEAITAGASAAGGLTGLGLAVVCTDGTIIAAAGAAPEIATAVIAGAGVVAAGAAAVGAAAASAVAIGAGVSLAAGAVMGILKTVLGPWRLAPELSFKLGGLPGMKQLSGISALKMVGSNLADGLKQAAAIDKNLNAKSLSIAQKLANGLNKGGASPPSISDANLSVVTDNSRVNPYYTGLYNNIAALQYFSTSTSATTYLSWPAITTTNVVSGLWYNIQKDFASTGTGSYQSIFFTAKYFTDGLSGLNPSSGIMTVEQVLSAVTTSTDSITNVLVPSSTVESLAGSFFDPDYINSCTVALATVINDASTSTTTLEKLTADRALLNTYTQNLLNRITSDATNQAGYLHISSQISSILNTANNYNAIKNSQSASNFNIYQSTIASNTYDTISLLSTIQDLQSANTATVQASIKYLSTTT
jgi:hypothetical protein